MSDLTIIKDFCRNGNTRKLSQLSRGSAIFFQKMCVVALQQPGTKHDIARRLLSYYDLDDYGQKINIVRQPRNKVEIQVGKMSVALTGARDGDVLSGASKGSKGALIKIHGHDVPPMRRTLDGVRGYPDLWHKFLTKLGSIPFFL